MGKAAVSIELTAPERRELESLARAHRTLAEAGDPVDEVIDGAAGAVESST